MLTLGAAGELKGEKTVIEEIYYSKCFFEIKLSQGKTVRAYEVGPPDARIDLGIHGTPGVAHIASTSPVDQYSAVLSPLLARDMVVLLPSLDSILRQLLRLLSMACPRIRPRYSATLAVGCLR